MNRFESDENEKKSPVCYSIGGYYSEGMLSDNPHAGIYEAKTSRTLDLNGGNPACNQGGICIVNAIGLDGYNSTDTGDTAATLGVNCGMSTGRNGVCIPYSVTDSCRLEDLAADALDQGDKYGDVATNSRHNRSLPCVLRQGSFANYVEGEFGTLQASGGDCGGGSENLIISRENNSFSNAVCNGNSAQTLASNTKNIKSVQEGICAPASVGINGDISGTLDASYYKGCGMRQGIEREVVAEPICIASGQAHAEICTDKCPTLNCTAEQPIVCGIDCRNGRLNDDLCGTLQAKPNGGFSYNFTHPVMIGNKEATSAYRYIVRRLTPTECARLQGFPDYWGHPDIKDELTDEEYHFWLKVRNDHASINGKKTKQYTRKQMLTWYNKLHSDSSEYKMWGNGVALPPTLYCMQGICDADHCS